MFIFTFVLHFVVVFIQHHELLHLHYEQVTSAALAKPWPLSLSSLSSLSPTLSDRMEQRQHGRGGEVDSGGDGGGCAAQDEEEEDLYAGPDVAKVCA